MRKVIIFSGEEKKVVPFSEYRKKAWDANVVSIIEYRKKAVCKAIIARAKERDARGELAPMPLSSLFSIVFNDDSI